MSFFVGAARTTIDGDFLGVGMLGYVQYQQTVEGARTPLSARAFYLRNTAGDRVAMVVCELAWITQAVRHTVLSRLERDHPDLGLGGHNVLLSATHTHSGPGGYSHHLIYNLSIPGFVPEVLEAISVAIVRAIVEASQSARPGRVSWARGEIPYHEPVAFNRSLRAYLANPDVAPVDAAHPERATSRGMTVLRLDRTDGAPIGALCWFGVHATSMHADNRLLDADNKGHAARQFEQTLAAVNPEFVAAFAQTCPADVSPSSRWDAAAGVMSGPSQDAVANARLNGEIQYRYARQIYEAAAGQPVVGDRLVAHVRYQNHGRIHVDPRHAFGEASAHTHRPRFELAMAMGTTDGRGPLFPFASAVRMLNRAARHRRLMVERRRPPEVRNVGRGGEGKVFPLVDLAGRADGKLLGLFAADAPRVPTWIYPAVAQLRARARRGVPKRAPWAPEVVPIQLVLIGPLAIAGLPGEPSTVAGRRLEHSLLRSLCNEDMGVDHVVVAGYANAYASYIVTFHEYQEQAYEGGSTLFGPWTLAAYQTRFDELVRRIKVSPTPDARDIGEAPYVATTDELEALAPFRPATRRAAAA